MKDNGKKNDNTTPVSFNENFWKALNDSNKLRERARRCRKSARAIALLEQGYRELCQFEALRTLNGCGLLRELIDLYVTTGQRERVAALAPLLVFLATSAHGKHSLQWAEAVGFEKAYTKR